MRTPMWAKKPESAWRKATTRWRGSCRPFAGYVQDGRAENADGCWQPGRREIWSTALQFRRAPLRDGVGGSQSGGSWRSFHS